MVKITIQDVAQRAGVQLVTARLVVLSARYQTGSALLFERSLGLCDTRGSVQQSIDLDLPWCTALCRQADDSCWNVVDVAALIGDSRFMEVTQ